MFWGLCHKCQTHSPTNTGKLLCHFTEEEINAQIGRMTYMPSQPQMHQLCLLYTCILSILPSCLRQCLGDAYASVSVCACACVYMNLERFIELTFLKKIKMLEIKYFNCTRETWDSDIFEEFSCKVKSKFPLWFGFVMQTRVFQYYT